MTKEPSKDFREEVAESVAMWMNWSPKSPSAYALADRILALCKEMLVPAKSECFECEVPYGHCCCYVRNGIRQGLLKQLGEKS